MKAPFPYFGGKSSVAPLVWDALGDCKHYLEPFFGSGAVLLNRPTKTKINRMETICDADGYVANVWRALQADPEAVAKVCDWPVNHADLSARKKKLIAEGGSLLERLIADDEYYDAKLAGYWVWSASCWIGSGLTSIDQIPHIGLTGMGVHSIGQIPHVSDAGKGVHSSYRQNIYVWFRQLSERLRGVRVVCGDWKRICGGDWQDNQGTAGIFLDPPYAVEDRAGVYNVESFTVAHEVRQWALERGQKESYRIVIAGYDEHEELLRHGWTLHTWSAQGGYGNSGNGHGKKNKKREMLYFSPHCLNNKKLEDYPIFQTLGA